MKTKIIFLNFYSHLKKFTEIFFVSFRYMNLSLCLLLSSLLFLNSSCDIFEKEDLKISDVYLPKKDIFIPSNEVSIPKGNESLPGCEKGELVNEDLFGIIGGKVPTESTWLTKGIVMLLVEESDGKYQLCTGALISKNFILTAAHCVIEVKADLSNLLIFFTRSISCENRETAPKIFRKAKELAIHPFYLKAKNEELKNSNKNEFSKKKNKGDLALIKLSSSAPIDRVPFVFSNEYIEINQDTKILAAGYGNTVDYNIEDENIMLRAVFLQPIKEKTKSKFMSFDKFNLIKEENLKSKKEKSLETIEKEVEDYYTMSPHSEFIFVDQTEGKGICSGDSGGASFVMKNGKMTIAGIASSVSSIESKDENSNGKFKKDEEEGLCKQVGIYTSIFFYKDWINNSILKMSENTSSN